MAGPIQAGHRIDQVPAPRAPTATEFDGDTPPARARAPIGNTLPIIVVEDHALLAHSLVVALRGLGMDARAAEDHQASVLASQVRERPCLVLLDLDLGRGTDGLALVTPLRRAGAHVVIVSGTADEVALAAAIEAGAAGCIHKSVPFADFVALVQRAAQGRALMDPRTRQELLRNAASQRLIALERAAALARLSRREQLVLSQLMSGLTAQEIASASTLAVTTVRSQIQSVLIKLGVKSQVSATSLARDAGFRPL